MPVMDRVQQGPGAPAMQQQSAPPQEPPPPEAGGEGGDAQDQEIDRFLDRAYQLIFKDGELNPGIVQALRTGTDSETAIEALADSAAQVGTRVTVAAKQAGTTVDGAGVVLPATLGLVEDIAGAAQQEEIYDYTPDEMNSALMKTAESLFNGTQELGLWDKAEFDQAAAEMVQAAKTGRGDEVIGELDGMNAPEEGAAPPGAPPTGPPGGMA